MKRRMALTVARAASVLLAVSALSAQEPKPAADGPGAPKVINDLTSRFRLHEKYVLGNLARPPQGEISQYRIGFKESFRRSDEKPQGAPRRVEYSRRAIYDERPSEVSSLDARRVTDVVRRYAGVQMIPDTHRKVAGGVTPFADLTIWLRTLPGDAPQILVLTPGRQLLDDEYHVASEQIFVPDLAYVLPELPVRIGETWPIARSGASTLAGHAVRQGTLTGKLLSVRADPIDGKHTAVIDVQGTVATELGEGPIHAELEFVFKTTPPPDKGPKAGADDAKHAEVIDAGGWIERISLAQEITGGQTGPDDRLKSTIARELILERRIGNLNGPPLLVPKKIPELTIENSWLTYVDPQNRFNFRHPQNMQLQPPPPGTTVYLLHPRTGGADYVFMTLAPRAELTPEALQQIVTDDLNAKGVEIVPGGSDWLPEADWPKMKVHRASLAMMPKGRNTVGGPRFHEFDYVLQTGRDSGLQVRATTNEDPPTTFRQEVESMLKTFQFGAPAGTAPASPATP